MTLLFAAPSSSVFLEREAAHHGGAAEFLPHLVDRALGERLAPARLVEEVAGIGLVGFDDVGDADADQAEARAVGLARQKIAAGGEYLLRKLRWIGEPAGAGADLELVALELERHGAAGKAAGLEPRRDFFRERPQPQFERAKGGEVAVECRLGGDALRFALRRHLALVDAARKAREAKSFGAVAAREVPLGRRRRSGAREEAVAREALLARLADAPDEADRLSRQERARLRTAQHGKSARLVEVGGDLRQEFVDREPDRHGDRERLLDPRREAGERFRRGHAVQALGAGEIHERLVDRERLDPRGELKQTADTRPRLPPPTITGWSRRLGSSRFSIVA